MELHGFARREVWEQVSDALRAQIILGELAFGERLIEADLAAQFGVSRGPVRSALTALERGGLVVSSPRRGAEVARFTQRDITELYSLREGLERLALENLRTPIGDEALTLLSAQLDRLDAARASNESIEAIEADLRFHRELVRLGHNSRLLAAWDNLSDQFMVVIGSVHRIDPSVAADSGEHRGVVDSLARENGEAAAALALTEHLQQSRRAMESWGALFVDDDEEKPVKAHTAGSS